MLGGFALGTLTGAAEDPLLRSFVGGGTERFAALNAALTIGPLLLSTLQLQSETQRKLELLDRDIGDVWVVASKVGVDPRPPSSSLDCVSDRAVANLHSV